MASIIGEFDSVPQSCFAQLDVADHRLLRVAVAQIREILLQWRGVSGRDLATNSGPSLGVSPSLDGRHPLEVFRTVLLKCPAEPALSSTGFEKALDELAGIQKQMREAQSVQDFQNIGHACREAILTLAQGVYDPATHRHPDGKNVSVGDASGMFEAYISTVLPGSGGAKGRALVRAAEAFASAVAHDRAATVTEARMAVGATSFLVMMIQTIAAKE